MAKGACVGAAGAGVTFGSEKSSLKLDIPHV